MRQVPEHPTSRDRLSSRGHHAKQRGFAFVMVLFLTIVCVGAVFSGSQLLSASRKRAKLENHVAAHAFQFARAGLTEAVNWFRRQPSQPVTSFAPRLDNSARPPVLDTIDADIGLVREWKISGRIWGRYEVWKEWPTDPDPERRKLRARFGISDVSLATGERQPGLVWQLKSRGIAYRKLDASKGPNVPPNRVIATDVVHGELRRAITIKLPGKAVVCLPNGRDCTVGTKARIEGGSSASGIAFASGTGNPTVTGQVSGSPPLAPLPVFRTDLASVVGTGLADLKQLADHVVDNASDLPDSMPAGSLVVVKNAATFDNTNPLMGRGIIVFENNVTFEQSSMSSYSGLMYINGNLTVRDGPTWIRGATVVAGTVDLPGTRDFASFTYDQTVIDDLRRRFNYRIAGAVERP